ncbi:SRPBCC family protein [Phaeacidiphilus oryzae]|uniref:SRPBCC family protein n=1 Tax=Phaeacidiphilus oryzae TaxID=348818 RepID=UPI001F3C2AAF|nr:SRPBCC family protein [Phaeacidiphilus oryzae]
MAEEWEPQAEVAAERSLRRTAEIGAPPEKVWQVVGDFQSLGDWHPSVPPAEREVGPDGGEFRVFRLGGQEVARERLVARDDAERRYSYAIVDPFLAISDYVATLAVLPAAGGSRVEWTATYRAHTAEAVAQVEEIFGDGTYGAGLEALRERFAGG